MLSVRPLFIWLILTSVSASIPAALATTLQTGPSSSTSVVRGVGQEVASAVDSAGRIHAAWVQRDQSTDPSSTTLWYSTYDPEFSSPRTVRRLDNCASIYSLSMTVDGSDNAHMVWVRRPLDVAGTANLTESFTTRHPVNELYYQDTNPGGVLASSPRLVLESQAESVWASIASGYDSQLYLAWMNVTPLNSSNADSEVYYARLVPHATVILAGSLVAKTTVFSRMLRVAASNDRNYLHLAWVEETDDDRSRVVHSEINLVDNSTKTRSVQDISGQVSQLTLAAIQNGEVVMGWTYEQPTENEPRTWMARSSLGDNATSAIQQMPLQDLGDPESIAVDFRGNLHVVWAYQMKDTRAGARPAVIRQQGFLHAELGDRGRFSEREEISYLPAAVAFVAGDGGLYAVSGGGVLEAASPVYTVDPFFVALAFTGLACLAGAMNTELGIYSIAPWVRTISWPMKRSVRSDSTDVRARMLRRIRIRPGITLSELKSSTERSAFQAAMQLRELETSGMIKSLRDGRRQRFYCLAQADDESHAEQLRRSIIDLVERTPGVNEAWIARYLGLSQQLTNYHLNRLVAARLLYRIRGSDNISYFVIDCIRAHSYRMG